MAGNIAQFQSPVDSLKPSDIGTNALAQEGRHVGALGKEEGEYYKGAIDSVGEPVAHIIDNHDYMTEVGQGAAAGAALANSKMAEWQQTASQPNAAHDPDLQKKFMDSLEPELQQLQNGYQTEAGQKIGMEQADRIRAEFYHTTSADLMTLKGEQSLQDLKTFSNQQGAMVAKSPATADFAAANIDAHFSALAADPVFASVRGKIELDKAHADALNENANVQVKAYADQGNFAAANAAMAAQGKLGRITPPEEETLKGYIANQKIARELQAMQEREQQKYKDIQFNEQTTHSVFSDMATGKIISATTAFSAKGLSPQQRADFITTDKSAPGILSIPRDKLAAPEYGPGFTATAEAMQRGEMVTPAGLTKGVRLLAVNSPQAITPAGAVRLQEIQDSMKTAEGQHEVQMQNSVLESLKSSLTFGGKYATDQKGKDIYSGMQNSFYTLWDSEIKSGKKPADLANPDSKDYIGNAFMPLKRSPAQALADVATAKPPTPTAKPTETDIAYIKANPKKAALYDQQFGKGAAAKVLGQ